jgi:diguanylate cyclase (GGDEF)-like protein
MADSTSEGDPDPATSPGSGRVTLGGALQARSRGTAHEVAAIFPVHVASEVEEAARFATAAAGRWLATGERGDEHRRQTGVLSTQQAILLHSDLATGVRGYLRWRDLCNAAVADDATRLGIGEETVILAGSLVQMICDVGLQRLGHVFDEGWKAVQDRLRLQQADMSHQLLHDDLTGLPNRILLADRLRRAALGGERRMTRSMLLFLDLDNFTAINDRFGHPAGDALLVEVARRLLRLVRASDTVARIGGDEFVILIEDIEEPEEAARSLADRIHEAMCLPVPVDDRELHSSVSIGITEVSTGLAPEAVLDQADAAMYRAKRGGPARFAVYDVVVGVEHRRKVQLADELLVAHGRGEFTLDYQPLFRVVDGSSGELTAMEALLRWDHPELGSIEPLEFVPLLEQSRQIVPVGRWVLEEAASQCVEWQRRFPDLSMSVNVSARQLRDHGFLEDVGDALRRSGLDPAHLVLEVTESALVVDVVRVGAVMQSVRTLGVQVALDDFGTGHSSLAFLQGLPIDRLKVDRTFVAGLGADGNDGTTIRTVVDLAHRLGITVVAEGVETAPELRAIRSIGCDEAQGLLLGRPVPAHLQCFDFATPVAIIPGRESVTK